MLGGALQRQRWRSMFMIVEAVSWSADIRMFPIPYFRSHVVIFECMCSHTSRAGASTTLPVDLGEASAASSSQTAVAAGEARSGAWLHELKSGQMPRVCAPGLGSGIFGAWAAADDEHEAAGKCVASSLLEGCVCSAPA